MGGDPAALILLDGPNARYAQRNWNRTLPDIAIFDATFVAQNVHAGEYVDRGHRTNLLQVIIGDVGVGIAKQVNDLDEAIRQKNSDISSARKSVQQHVPQGTKLESFIALAKDPDLDTKLNAKTAELAAAKRAGEIKNRAAPTEVTVHIPPTNLLPTLAKTLANVSSDAKMRLEEQIAMHKMHENGEAWLSHGLGYLHDEQCPFCGQNTNGLSLVDAYREIFSDAYHALREEIEQLRAGTEATFGEAALATLGRALATNEAAGEFWRQFTGLPITSPDHDHAIAAPARKLRLATLTLIARKLANPLEEIQPDTAFKAALHEYKATEIVLAEYNASVRAANSSIETQKQDAQAADAAAIGRDIAALQLVTLRHDPKISATCADYETVVREKNELDQLKNAAKSALDKHADNMIGNYESTINQFLKGFGASFSITNSKKSYVGGTPTSSYQILINNYAIDLGDSGTPIGQPSFRTTLSAGDKSTLALAFFLAKLEHDPNKASKIIVFDDPFNSQDRSRRERTAELLRKYGQDCQQLLLFSHDPYFLSLVYSKLPKAVRHALQLSRAADNNTTIEEWDVEKETKDGYFREHAALASYLLNGANELIDIARKIRPVLEGYLRYRFPNQFPDNEWLGDMIKRVRDAGAVHQMHDALEELTAINDYSKKYHHDTNPGKADSEPLNDGELQTFIQRTLVIVGGY